LPHARFETCSEEEEIVKPTVSMQDLASRKIVQGTQGLSHGPIARLMSPSDPLSLRAALFPSHWKSRKPETLLGSNSLVPNALRMVFSLHLAPADLAASNDIENQTDLREKRDPNLFVG
jgi:hypothetical protein